MLIVCDEIEIIKKNKSLIARRKRAEEAEWVHSHSQKPEKTQKK